METWLIVLIVCLVILALYLIIRYGGGNGLDDFFDGFTDFID